MGRGICSGNEDTFLRGRLVFVCSVVIDVITSSAASGRYHVDFASDLGTLEAVRQTQQTTLEDIVFLLPSTYVTTAVLEVYGS